MKFRPIHDRVALRRVDSESKTPGGIIIPDTAAEKPQQGEVIAVGPGVRGEDVCPDGSQERRPGPIRQMVRNRGQDRWRRAPDHEGERRHGRAFNLDRPAAATRNQTNLDSTGD